LIHVEKSTERERKKITDRATGQIWTKKSKLSKERIQKTIENPMSFVPRTCADFSFKDISMLSLLPKSKTEFE
jgi:hypothetical protein